MHPVHEVAALRQKVKAFRLKPPDQDRVVRLHDKLSRELASEVCTRLSDASVIE